VQCADYLPLRRVSGPACAYPFSGHGRTVAAAWLVLTVRGASHVALGRGRLAGLTTPQDQATTHHLTV
jgi:hypothetical protein